MDIWQEMLELAERVHHERTLSPFVEAGGVAAAIQSESGKIYVGVCIDTASSLGMCAERAAIANMITCGDSRIVRMLAVMGNGSLGAPCGACQELMMQLNENHGDIEIMMDMESREIIHLSDLMPIWWGEKIK